MRIRGFAVAAVLAVLTFLLYFPTVQFEFLNFDDNTYVTGNPHVNTGVNAENIVWAFSRFHSSNWHPVTWMSHMLDCQIWGANPGPAHLVNAAFHSANSVLLFFLLRYMTGVFWRAALVAALFAWHPLHVESVAWIAERKDLLSAIFMFLTLAVYTKHVRSSGRFPFWPVVVLYVLGVMSKPMLVTLPFLLLVLDFWPLGRLQWSGRPLAEPATGKAIQGRQPMELIREKIPLFLISLVSCVVTFIAQKQSGAVSGLHQMEFVHRIWNPIIAYVEYLEKMAWPSGLVIFYPFSQSISPWKVVQMAAFLIVVTGFAAWQYKRRSYFLTGWLWYLGTLVPVIGIVQVGAQRMADRYTYIPLIGIFILVAWGLFEVHQRLIRFRWVVPAFVSAILAACIYLTYLQIPYWRDSITVFSRVLEIEGPADVAFNNIGVAKMAENQLDEAEISFRKALELWPNFPEVHFNLGTIMMKRGMPEEAIGHYEKAAANKPGYVIAHNDMAIALTKMGRLDEAVSQLKNALKFDPNSKQARANLREIRRIQEADPTAERLINVRPEPMR